MITSVSLSVTRRCRETRTGLAVTSLGGGGIHRAVSVARLGTGGNVHFHL